MLKVALGLALAISATGCAIKVHHGQTFTSRGQGFVVLQEDSELVLIRDRKSTDAGGIEGYVDEIVRVDCHAVEPGQVYAVPNVPNRAFRFECDGTVTYFLSPGAAAAALPLPIKEPRPRSGDQPTAVGN
jgi:hypothetical protein